MTAWPSRAATGSGGTTVRSFDDHRIAMAMGVAGLVAEGETIIEGAECARISFPGFWEVLDRLAGRPVAV